MQARYDGDALRSSSPFPPEAPAWILSPLPISARTLAPRPIRADRARRHEPVDILVIALSAVLCGAGSWVEVERFGTARTDWLRIFLAVTPRHPLL